MGNPATGRQPRWQVVRGIERTAVNPGVTAGDESPSFAIPAESGIEVFQDFLDPGVGRDELGSLVRSEAMHEMRR